MATRIHREELGLGPHAPVEGVSREQRQAGITGRHGTSGVVESDVPEPDSAGVFGIGPTGVQGVSLSSKGSGVWGHNARGGVGVTGFGDGPQGVGVVGRGAGAAGHFHGTVKVFGDVEVTGDIRLTNADLAEDFDVSPAAAVTPGCVVVLVDDGSVAPCCQPFDTRVAGVISGAERYRPAVVLDRQPPSRWPRQPVAMVGKVFCRVDATYGAIRPGDLLTTSATEGHAMRAGATPPGGCLVGKALAPWREGRGLIPILVVNS